MTQTYTFRIDYYSSNGHLMFSDFKETPMDHWDLCAHIWDNLPKGAEDFHVAELPVKPLSVEAATWALCA